MSHYIGDCTIVYGPIGKRKDGSWSRRRVILAAFRDPKEAAVYEREKRRKMIPAFAVKVEERR